MLKAKKIQGTKPNGEVRHYLNTGFPPLNEAITDDIELGLPSGQLVMIGGPSAAGKTVILSEIMISAQKAGGFAGMFDFETQFQMELSKLRGLSDGSNWEYWQPDTFEEAVSTSIQTAKLIRENKLIPDSAPIVFGFDSLHSMTPQSKYDNMMDKAIEKGERVSMHDNYALSAATSAWFPVMQREFNKYNVTGIFLNQVRRKLDPQGREYYTFPGGDAPYYYCSTVIVLTGANTFEGTGKDRQLMKKEITALIDKSRNTIPFSKVKWDFMLRPRKEFDVIGSYAKHLQQLGAIETRGSRVGWKGKSPYLSGVIEELRGQEDAIQQLKDVHNAFKKDGTITYPYPKKGGEDEE